MIASEVKQLFLEFIDETDTTFQSDASTDSFLNLGYEEFRNFAMQHAPGIFLKSAFIDMNLHQDPNTRAVDLAGAAVIPVDRAGVAFAAPIMGPLAVPGERLVKLRTVNAVDTTNVIRYKLDQVQRQEDFYNYTNTSNPQVCLEGTLLFTSQLIGDRIQLDYLEQPSISWNTAQYLDDLNLFHPLIAIYAARYYMIKDGGISEQLEFQGRKLETSFAHFLEQGRTQGGWYVQY